MQFAAFISRSQTHEGDSLEQLIQSLPAVLRASESSAEVYTAACVAAWNHTAGEGLRCNAVAIRFAENRLTIAVADAIWQKQLQPMMDQLIYRLNTALGQRLVHTIEFTIAPSVVADALRQRGTNQVERSVADYPPEIISAASSIHDPQLRRVFLSAANSSLARLKHSEEQTNADKRS